MKSSGIGGQAVMEGIMMKNQDDYAVAVRRPDGEIQVEKGVYRGVISKCKLFRLPFIRGVFNFADSLILGMKTLSFSAEIAVGEEEEEEPSKFEKWLDQKFGDRLEKVIMNVTMVISVILAVGIFMVLPTLLSSLVKPLLPNEILLAFAEGLIRILIFILYLLLVSRMQEIRRTYMYHGAEHKCINCIEHGMELTVDNVMKSSRLHKRCGTSFLLIVMLISILFFMVIRVDQPLLKILSRIILIPVIAGVSYEFLRIAGNSDHWMVNLLSKPGLLMQKKLTTLEPTPEMAAVAIEAVEAVFDWREYLRLQFGTEFPKEDRTTEEKQKEEEKQ